MEKLEQLALLEEELILTRNVSEMEIHAELGLQRAESSAHYGPDYVLVNDEDLRAKITENIEGLAHTLNISTTLAYTLLV